jgi:hypothetical protein
MSHFARTYFNYFRKAQLTAGGRRKMKVLKRWGREIACEEFHLILHLLSNERTVNAQ